MMQTEQARRQTEELSREIDKLTIEGHQAVADPELDELLEVADMLNHSCPGDEIPHSLIGSMADTLAVELTARQERRRRSRLYTVLAGSAAAVVLAVGVQLTLFQQHSALPPAEQLEARLTPSTAPADKAYGEPKQAAPAPAGGQQAKEKAPAAPPDSEVKPQIAAGLLPAAVADKINETVRAAKGEENSEQLAMNAADIAPEQPQPELRLMAKARMAAPAGEESGAEQTITHLLVLPGRTAQSVTVAPDRKQIEQIYKLHGRDEVRVIQRLPGVLPAADAADEASRPSNASTVNDKVNRVTVTRDGYEVSVEGRQPTAELKKLADSLVIREAMP